MHHRSVVSVSGLYQVQIINTFKLHKLLGNKDKRYMPRIWHCPYLCL